MILEHGLDLASAKWDGINNKWDVGQKRKYRWCKPDDTPASDWFYTMAEVIDWIIDYETAKESAA